ncbi:hypothetical protein [Gluconobacter frateurii]|uniref:Uncharacterized protein n=1 Tax=Gluconobacter frateurii NRIC 0228 TaxID=1307946 RepID=A0ABQ0QFQ8_9PROT|nr:hypothetical protein [Gluconobacter frateurii]GBR17421.1 hypothetical protein AA0228_3023 [Gluconobacter frateurii NRIC 0228]GLP89600.1 hypothetical protein GCM10007868_06750 [Gluconobacter frateurii]
MEEFAELYKKFQKMSVVCNRIDLKDEDGVFYYQQDGIFKCIYTTNLLRCGVEAGGKAIVLRTDNSLELVWLDQPTKQSVRISNRLDKLVISQSGKITETDYTSAEAQQLLEDQELWFYLALSEKVTF